MGVYTCWPAGAPGIIATPVVEEGRRRWEGGREEGGKKRGRKKGRRRERKKRMKGVSVHQLIKHVEKLQGSHIQKTMIVGTRLQS